MADNIRVHAGAGNRLTQLVEERAGALQHRTQEGGHEPDREQHHHGADNVLDRPERDESPTELLHCSPSERYGRVTPGGVEVAPRRR